MTFTKNQAEVMRVLWTARENQEGELSESEILDRAKLNADRLVDVFKIKRDRRTAQHEAWGSVVIQAPSSKGMYKLL